MDPEDQHQQSSDEEKVEIINPGTATTNIAYMDDKDKAVIEQEDNLSLDEDSESKTMGESVEQEDHLSLDEESESTTMGERGEVLNEHAKLKTEISENVYEGNEYNEGSDNEDVDFQEQRYEIANPISMGTFSSNTDDNAVEHRSSFSNKDAKMDKKKEELQQHAKLKTVTKKNRFAFKLHQSLSPRNLKIIPTNVMKSLRMKNNKKKKKKEFSLLRDKVVRRCIRDDDFITNSIQVNSDLYKELYGENKKKYQ